MRVRNGKHKRAKTGRALFFLALQEQPIHPGIHAVLTSALQRGSTVCCSLAPCYREKLASNPVKHTRGCIINDAGMSRVLLGLVKGVRSAGSTACCCHVGTIR